MVLKPPVGCPMVRPCGLLLTTMSRTMAFCHLPTLRSLRGGACRRACDTHATVKVSAWGPDGSRSPFEPPALPKPLSEQSSCFPFFLGRKKVGAVHGSAVYQRLRRTKSRGTAAPNPAKLPAAPPLHYLCRAAAFYPWDPRLTTDNLSRTPPRHFPWGHSRPLP